MTAYLDRKRFGTLQSIMCALFLIQASTDDTNYGKPADRLPTLRPFPICGFDFCGPVYTTLKIRGRPQYKSYVALYVCFASKAVHIEIVPDLSTDFFLLAFQRFIDRRGFRQSVY